MKKSKFIFILLLLYVSKLEGKNNIDSLLLKLNTTINDTTKIKILNTLSSEFIDLNNYEQALAFAIQAKNMSKKLNYEFGIIKALIHEGLSYWHKGKNNNGLKCFFEASNRSEKINYVKGIEDSNGNIAILYGSQGKFKEAMTYQKRVITSEKKSGNLVGLSKSLNNLGLMLYSAKDFASALIYFDSSIYIKTKLTDYIGIAASLDNKGVVYDELKDFNNALKSYIASLSIAQKLNNQRSIASSFNNIGSMYVRKNELNKAEDIILKSVKISKELGLTQYLCDSYLGLVGVYELKGDFKNAFQFQKLLEIEKEKMLNEESVKQQADLEAKFTYDKKAAKDSIRSLEERKVLDAQVKAEQTQKYALYGGLILLVTFSIFIFNRFKLSQKQKNIIQQQKLIVEEQKYIVEEKQKEILDSIAYAKRLQQAILVKQEVINLYLPNNFIVLLPKDIVAGDFYFFEKVKNNIFIAAADCTGHGVPGAMVSVVCSNALSRCVKEFNITDTGKILDKTRELILETFEKGGELVKDGMDISLIRIELDENRQLKELNWSGANNPLLYSVNNSLLEINATKQPIGQTDNPKPFVSHQLPLNTQNLFLFTDGYTDQFGGEKGKKFKYANFKKIIESNLNTDLPNLKSLLINSHTKWRGELEQTDDVTLIGIKLQ